MQWKCIPAFILAVALVAVPAGATLVQQMDLAALCQHSAYILRGEVVAVIPGTVSVGGASFPATTYKVRVDEEFKGTFTEEKGVKIAQFTMLGSVKEEPHQVGNAAFHSPIAGMPQLRLGEEYLLMVSPASAAGLSATIGLGQGCFSIGDDKLELTVNEANNAGLLSGVGPGPLSYADLANHIQTLLGQ